MGIMNVKKFLGIFDPVAETATTAQPAPAAEPAQVIPLSALPSVLAMMQQTQGDAVQKAIEARQQLTKVQQASATPPPPPEKQGEKLDLLVQQVSQLHEQLRLQQLETYRLEAIKRSGRPMVEALVQGNTPVEIDASINLAVAEYAVISSQVAQQLETQLKAQAVAASASAPAAPQSQATVSQVSGQPVINAPSFVQTPGIPEQQAPGTLSNEQINYLTTHGLRNGSYAQNRDQIFRQLRGLAPNGYNTPQGQFSPAPQQIPVPMPTSAYAGVQMPVAAPAPVHAAPGTFLPPQQPQGWAPPPNPYFLPQQAMSPQAMYQPAPMPMGAPQPWQVEAAGGFDPSAARFAASNSAAQARIRAQSVPNIHSQ